jgi:hypothetical protein
MIVNKTGVLDDKQFVPALHEWFPEAAINQYARPDFHLCSAYAAAKLATENFRAVAE